MRHWSRAGSGLLISMPKKLNCFFFFFFFFDGFNNTDTIDVRMDWSILEERSSFKMPGLIFSSKLD